MYTFFVVGYDTREKLFGKCLITKVLFSVLNQTLTVETKVWQHNCWIQYHKYNSFDRRFV